MVALLDANTLVVCILAWLLEREGYDTKALEAYPVNLIAELLEGVDVLLLIPFLGVAVRRAFLDVLSSLPQAAQRTPVLSLSIPLQVGVLDELAVNVSWQSFFEGLVQELETVLRRAEVCVEMLLPKST